jgi:hypothetical protein
VTLFIERSENQFQNKFHVVKIHLFGIILLCPSYDHRLICSGSGWPQDHPHMIVDIIDRHRHTKNKPAPLGTQLSTYVRRCRVIDADRGEQRWTGEELADGRLWSMSLPSRHLTFCMVTVCVAWYSVWSNGTYHLYTTTYIVPCHRTYLDYFLSFFLSFLQLPLVLLCYCSIIIHFILQDRFHWYWYPRWMPNLVSMAKVVNCICMRVRSWYMFENDSLCIFLNIFKFLY